MLKIGVLVCLFALVSCTSNSTIPVPVQVSNDINVLATTTDAAITALIAAQQAGKISQSDLNIANQIATTIAVTGKAINSELRSADDWTVQKSKIIQLITNAGVGALNTKLSPNAQLILAASLTAFNQISAAVGGPVI